MQGSSECVPKSIWESCSAFANTIGGTILLGVTEDLKEKDLAKRYSITGVEDKMKMIKSFWDTINSSKVNANILLDSDVQPLNVDGKDIIVITVPQADWRTKPVFLNENVYKGTFKRNHEGDYHCTESEIKAIVSSNRRWSACSDARVPKTPISNARRVNATTFLPSVLPRHKWLILKSGSMP